MLDLVFQNGTFIVNVMEEDVVVTLEEQVFNGNVREWIVSLSILLFIFICSSNVKINIIIRILPIIK